MITDTRKSAAGPGYYLLPTTVGMCNQDISRKSSPAFSFGSRARAGRVSETPSPQTYDLSHLTRFGRSNVPSCSLAGRLKHGGWYPTKKNMSPGPGAYSPELCGSIQAKCAAARLESCLQSTPSVRTSTMTIQHQSALPGPGTYDVTPLDIYKTRQPRFKMSANATNRAYIRPSLE